MKLEQFSAELWTSPELEKVIFHYNDHLDRLTDIQTEGSPHYTVTLDEFAAIRHALLSTDSVPFAIVAGLMAYHQSRSTGMTYSSPDTCVCGNQTLPAEEAHEFEDVRDRRFRSVGRHQADVLKRAGVFL